MTASHAFLARTRVPNTVPGPRKFQPAERLPGSIDLADLERLNADLATASLAEMAAEHDDLNRWLNVPHAEEWADQHREKSARLKALWQAIGRRFPQYVAKRGFRRTA